MKTKVSFLFAILFGLSTYLGAQDFSGNWIGELPPTGSSPAFRYELQLVQQGEAVSGQSFSQSADGKLAARFEVSGRWDGQQLVLQEIRQLWPSSPRWCLKFATLFWSNPGGYPVLNGQWTAQGCAPGSMVLRRQGDPVVSELPFSYAGRWTGHLSQKDRPYGFYFEINLAEDGSGTSNIVSEGSGGEATHQLLWSQEGEQLVLREQEVIERTDPQWRWCIKTLQLQANRADESYHLEGDWTGYIEGHDSRKGACAPGTVVLEKPVLTQSVQSDIQPMISNYGQQEGRPVRIDRVIKVQGDNIKLSVWDNGIVDGDIVTLFLNGNQILKRHRVNKSKMTFPIEVQSGENLLILHAEDLGSVSPNTVAVSINDGFTEQVIILSSNLRESGAVLIQPFGM